MLAVKARQRVGELEHAARRHHPDRDSPADQSGELVDRQSGAVDRGQRRTRVGEKRRPDVGQPHDPPGAVEQRLAQLLLKAPDLGADTRLGYVAGRGPPPW